MNVLYLHGLLSSNKSPKVEYLKELGYKVFNPKLLYKIDKETMYNNLKELILKNEIEFLIGSSMGGYLAFHLANELHKKTLLFNPSLQSISPNKPNIPETTNINCKHYIVIGKNDTTVLPNITLTYLKTTESNCHIEYEDYGHQTPIEPFKKHAHIFLKI